MAKIVFQINSRTKVLDVGTGANGEWPALTEQQAMIVAAMDMGSALREIAIQLGTLAQATKPSRLS